MQDSDPDSGEDRICAQGLGHGIHLGGLAGRTPPITAAVPIQVLVGIPSGVLVGAVLGQRAAVAGFADLGTDDVDLVPARDLLGDPAPRACHPGGFGRIDDVGVDR